MKASSAGIRTFILSSLTLLTIGCFPGRSDAAQVATYAPTESTEGLFSVGLRFGTTGLGADLAFPLSETTRLRFVGSMGSFAFNGDISDIEYAIDVTTPTLGGLLDWHPGAGAFRLSLGGFYSGIEADGSARPTDSVEVGDSQYSPAEVGVLDATLKYPSVMGYVGFGFGNAFIGSRWTVSLDVGLLLGPSPDFSLVSRDGLLSDYSAFQDEVAKEEQQIRTDVTDKLQFYPVISMGLSFRF